MSLKTKLSLWDLGCNSYENNNIDLALEAFEQIASNSKIIFNIAMIYQFKFHKHDIAIRCFTECIELDPYFAAAYFQRGYLFYAQKNSRMALRDLDQCEQLMQENKQIDYSQLGLNHPMYAFDIYHNRAILNQSLGNKDAALADITSAGKTAITPKQENWVKKVLRNNVLFNF
jgi:tetratricopeptide (TPR) repeat protein